MTSRLLIFFSLLIAPLGATVVNGRIFLTEESHGIVRSVKPTGTVVWLESLSPDAADRDSKRESSHFTIVQKNKSFTPHVLAIPVGSTVDFPNSDPIFHNAFSNYDGQIFDIGLYPPGKSRSVKFSSAGIVRLFCNIHANMSAVIIVLETPFFTSASDDGAFSIDEVPEGKYRLSIYNEHADEKTMAAEARAIAVAGTNQDVGSITLRGSSFLNIPHLNKYGKEYPPVPDSGVYMGARP